MLAEGARVIFLRVSLRERALRQKPALISKDLDDNSRHCEQIFVLVVFSVPCSDFSFPLLLLPRYFRQKLAVISNFIIGFLKIFYLSLERGEGREKRGRETSVCGCLLCAPYWEHGLQPRHVP